MESPQNFFKTKVHKSESLPYCFVMQDTGCMMQDREGPDLGYRYPEPGTRHRSRSDAEDRTPSAEDRKRAHRVCIMQDRAEGKVKSHSAS